VWLELKRKKVMLKRTALAVICLSWLAGALPAVAQERATVVLRSGERVNADLVDLGGVGFTVRENGQERRIPQNEVAVIVFQEVGRLPGDAQSMLDSGRQFVVLRNGQVVEGRLSDIGGTTPLRVTIDTPSGQRNFNSSEVAEVHMSKPGAGSGGAVATTGGDGVTTVTLQGNADWTPTNVTVRQGETLAFSTSGQIRFSPNPEDTAGAGGAGRQPKSASAPLPRAPKGALLGRIDNGPAFLIGDNRTVRMPANGTLYLRSNDDMVSDNSGSLQVTIDARARRR
jgi:hypothetical protein